MLPIWYEVTAPWAAAPAASAKVETMLEKCMLAAIDRNGCIGVRGVDLVGGDVQGPRDYLWPLES